MKKIRQMYDLPEGRFVKRWLLFMRNLLFFLLIGTMSVCASNLTIAQKVSLKVNNVDLKTVITSIEEQTKLGFLYNEEDVEILKNISLDVREMEVLDVLDMVLRGTRFVYSIDKETILISLKKNTQDSTKTVEKRTLRGRVTDTKKATLPGVSVYVKGTTIGVATNEKGEYTMTLIPTKDLTLVFSFIGMKSKEVLVKGQQVINVVLEEDVSDLDEVKVVAYGKSTKREMTGAVSSIKGEDILSIPSSNLSSMLQGRIAGMDVSNISGSPGSAGTATVVRGFNSLANEQRDLSSPLWVIDGVPVSNMTSSITGTSVLSELDPEMIESIEVLKDAAAASLYGSRAANGVILVTTKKGKEGQRTIRAGLSYTYSYIPEYPTVFAGSEARRYVLKALENERSAYINTETQTPVYPTSYVDAYRMAQLYKQGRPSFGYWWGDGTEGGAQPMIRELQDSLNSFHNNSSNWFKKFFNVGKILNANVQATIGAKNFNASTGVSFYDEKGIVRNTGFQRFTFLTNVGFIPADYFTINASMSLSYAKRKRNSDELLGVRGSGVNLPQVSSVPFTTSPFLPDNKLVEGVLLRSMDGIDEKNDDVRLRASLALGVDFTSWLRLVSTNSVEYALSRNNKFTPSYLDIELMSKSEGRFEENRMLLSENLLTFKKTFQDVHSVELMGGMTIQHDETNTMTGSGRNGPSDYVHYVNGSWPSKKEYPYGVSVLKSYGSNFVESSLVSFLGRVNYNYMKRYLFSATIRRDGSSKFGKAKPWGTFPAVSAGWVFSDEDFLDFADFLDFGKLRVSWGETGSQFSAPYLAYGLFGSGGTFLGNPSVKPNSIAGLVNPTLSWETTSQYNLGLDVDLLNYRLGVVMDYYYRMTDGVLSPVVLPSDYSIMSNQFKNAGSILNTGIEVSVKYDIFRRDDLRWRLNVNFARNWNKFKDSYNGKDMDNYVIGKPLNGIKLLKSMGIIQDANDVPYKYLQNGSKVILSPYNQVTQFYTTGDIRYLDANGDGQISVEKDAVYIGSPLPKAQGGILNEVQWKNFDLGLVFNYSLGRTIVNANKGSGLTVDGSSLKGAPILVDIREYTFWEKPGDNADFARLAFEQGKSNFGVSSDVFVENVNYLRLKSCVIGYTLPTSVTNRIHLAKVRVYMSGENLFTWTNYTGMDPETVDIMTGFDSNRSYPLSRKFTLGLSVNF